MTSTNDTTTSSALAELTDDQVLDELGRRRKAAKAQEQADLQALRDELRSAHLAAETAQLRRLYEEVSEQYTDDDAFRAAVTEHQTTARRKYRELLGDDALTDLVAREEGFAGDWSFEEGMVPNQSTTVAAPNGPMSRSPDRTVRYPRDDPPPFEEERCVSFRNWLEWPAVLPRCWPLEPDRL